MNGIQKCDSPMVAGLGLVEPPTLLEQLKQRRAGLEQQLAHTNEAIAALEASPEVCRAVEAISKVGGLGRY